METLTPRFVAMLPHVDADLRHRKVRGCSSTTHSTLHASWRHLIKLFPANAGTVRSMERYLTAIGVTLMGMDTHCG